MGRSAASSVESGSLLFGGGGGVGYTRGDDGIQERHHGPELRAKLFELTLLFGFALGQKIGAALFVLFDPGFGKAAIADARQKFLHFLTGLLGDDARPGVVIALLGG